MKRIWTLTLSLLCVACGAGNSEPEAAQTTANAAERPAVERVVLQVAAASDLTRAFEEVGKAYEAKTGQKVVFTFGSTGLLAKQIREGAPFDLFAAANVSFVTELVAAGACDGATQAPYARGRIAVYTKYGLVTPPASLADLADARFRRIAIANPEHAPYGKAAKQALEKLGIFQTVQARIVYGENVKQTLQFAESGNAEAAIVALSLVLGTNTGTYALVDSALHDPIDQALVVCKGGRDQAGGRTFASYVGSAGGRGIMRRYGFLLPGEALVRAP